MKLSTTIKRLMMICLVFLISCSQCFGQDRVEKLIQQLKDKNSDVRYNAAETLGEIKDARAVEPLWLPLKIKTWKL